MSNQARKLEYNTYASKAIRVGFKYPHEWMGLIVYEAAKIWGREGEFLPNVPYRLTMTVTPPVYPTPPDALQVEVILEEVSDELE